MNAVRRDPADTVTVVRPIKRGAGRLRVRAALGIALLAGLCRAGAPAAYRDAEVRLVNPFPATGPVELAGSIAGNKVLRALQNYGTPALTDRLAWHASRAITAVAERPVAIARRPRARGMIAHRDVARAPADGRTLLLSDSASLMVYPLHGTNPGFDPVHDLTPVAVLATMPSVLAVAPASGATSIDAILFAAKGGRRIDFGSAGPFTAAHFALERFRRAAGIRAVHIGYNGGNGAVNALAAAQIAQAFVPLPAALPYARSGVLRLMALASRNRFPGLPDLPTFAEAGLAGVEAEAWYGIFAPAGTPQPLVRRLNRGLVDIFDSESRQLLSQGLAPSPLGPGEFASAIARERAALGPLLSALTARDGG